MQCKIFAFWVYPRLKLGNSHNRDFIYLFFIFWWHSFVIRLCVILLRRYVSYLAGSPSTIQHFLYNNFFVGVSVYQQHVAFTGPLLTHIGYPRDPLAISDLWPHPSESFHCLTLALTPTVWHSGIYCKEVKTASQYCQRFNSFSKYCGENTLTFISFTYSLKKRKVG